MNSPLRKSPLERPLRCLENTIRRYAINIYVHDKAILKTDVGMSICSDSSTIWDWAWNSCFGSLTCLSKFTNFCGNARNVNFCMGRTETSQHWSKLCNLQLPDKGDKQYVSAWKNIEFPKTSRNNLAESTLESSSLNQIFSNHSMACSPFFPLKTQTLAHLSFLEMFWFPAQTWCQKQRRVQTWAKFTIPYHFNSHHFYQFYHFSSRTFS